MWKINIGNSYLMDDLLVKIILNGLKHLKEITACVSQGSILGPFSFIIFINEMFMCDSSVDDKSF